MGLALQDAGQLSPTGSWVLRTVCSIHAGAMLVGGTYDLVDGEGGGNGRDGDLSAGWCGASDEEQAADTVRTYLEAFVDGNGQRACEQLTDAVQRRIVDMFSEGAPSAGITSCEQAIGAIADLGSTQLAEPVEIKVERVTVDGEQRHGPHAWSDR